MSSKENQLKDIKSMLAGLVLSCPGGISVNKLRRDYREMMGEDIPFRKFDYADVISFLKSLDDSVVVRGNDSESIVFLANSSKSKTIVDMISNQKRGRPRRDKRTHFNRTSQPRFFQNASHNMRKEYYRPHRPFIHWPDSNSSFRSFSEARRNLNILPAEEGRKYRKDNFSLDCDSSFNQSETEFEKCNRTAISSDCHGQKYRKTNISSDFDLSYDTELEDDHDDRNKSSVNISRNKSELKSVHNKIDEKGSEIQLNKYFGDIPMFNENEVFYSDDDEPTNYSHSEYETCSISERLDDNCDTKSQGTSTLCSLNFLQKRADDFIPKSMKANLQELISEYENGLWCCELPGIYKERFGSELNYIQYGFFSMSAFCKELSDVFHCIRPSNSDWKLFDARLPPPITEKETKPSYNFRERVVLRDGALPFFEKPVIKKKYPINVMTLGDTLTCEWLPEEMDDGFLEMKVAEVYDPSKFWIMRRDKYPDLNKLMEDLQVYYILNPSDYVIPDELIEVGLVCAGIACGEYHRMIVVKIENEKQVRIFCVDYGTVDLCEKSTLRFLPRDFAHLPQQAIRSRLHNLRPKHPEILWSRNSAHMFLDSVRDKELLCVINASDFENKTLEITLYDTSTDQDICINDLMVEKKVADYITAPKNQNPVVTDPKGKIDERLVSVYVCPSFEDIEAGLVPIFSELALLDRCNMNIELIFAAYIQAAKTDPNFNAATFSIHKDDKSLPTENETELTAKSETLVSEIIPYEEKEELPDVEQLNIEETEQNKDESIEQDVEDEKNVTEKIEIDTESLSDELVISEQTFTDSYNENKLRTVQPPPGFNFPPKIIYNPVTPQESNNEACKLPIEPTFQHQPCHLQGVLNPPPMAQCQQQHSHSMSVVSIQQNFTPQGFMCRVPQYQQGYNQQMGMIPYPYNMNPTPQRFPQYMPPPNFYHPYAAPFIPFPGTVPYSNYPNFQPRMSQPRHYSNPRTDNVSEVAYLVRLLEIMDGEKSLNEKDVLRELNDTNPALIPIYKKFKIQKETHINIIEQLKKKISDLKAMMTSEENAKSLSEKIESRNSSHIEAVETDCKKVKEIENKRISEKESSDEPDEKDINDVLDKVKDIRNEEHKKHETKNKKTKLVDVEINGKTIHIINIDGELYLSTQQILEKFTPFSDVELVRKTFYSVHQYVWPSTRYNLNEFSDIKEQLLKSQIPLTRSGCNQIVDLLKINDVSTFLKTIFIEPTRISNKLLDLIESKSLHFD